MDHLLHRTVPRVVNRLRTYRGLRVSPDLRYAKPDACRLDVLRPADAAGPLPTVLHLHGGAFRVFSKDTHGHAAARYARAGFAVVNVDYRLAPRHPFPAAVRDVHRALQWIADRQDHFGLDLDRLILAGESAGANLALGLGLSCLLERPEPWARDVWELGVTPRALHPACGLLQVSDPQRYGRDLPASAILSWRLPSIVSDYLDPSIPPPDYADPLRILESLAPRTALSRPAPAILALCGTADPIADDTRRLIDAGDRLGLDVQAAWFPRGGHGFHLLPGHRAQRAWRTLIDHATTHTARLTPTRSSQAACC